MDVPDLDALLAALPSPEFAAAEAKDGVVAESIVMLVESQRVRRPRPAMPNRRMVW
jgi:hypothetical protein